MIKNSKELSAERERLAKENDSLRQQLDAARESIDSIRNGDIDALVIADKKALKIYTEKTADKIYRILIEKMHEGAVTLNNEGIILFSNSYFANLVTLPLQKIIGTKFNDHIFAPEKKHFDELLLQIKDKPIKSELHIQPKDGRVVPVLMSINTLELNKEVAVSIILTDLTVQNEDQEKLRQRTKQLEQKNTELENVNKELAFQIEQKEKKKAELSVAKTDVKELGDLNTHKENVIATLSHDLRSPLAGIIQIAGHLKESFEKLEPANIKELLELLFEASKTELNMLDYLVEWARIKYASEVFAPVEINLFQYVKKVFDTLQENASQNELQLINQTDKDIEVFADEKMLTSILQNIISNSIKHTRPSGKIEVIATHKEKKVVVEVKDTGIGMSKEIKEKLFTPQMGALLNARKENKGAGIGLLLVKSFVEKNGGEIWVESVEGEGSSFYFTLPLSDLSKKLKQ